MDTLSDRLNIIKNINIKKQENEKKRNEKWFNKLDKYVENKFRQAQKELGNRLDTQRSHECMHHFYFDVNTNPNNSAIYLNFYINLQYINRCKSGETLWRLTCYDRFQDRKEFRDKIFRLKDLNKIIRNYVDYYFENQDKKEE